MISRLSVKLNWGLTYASFNNIKVKETDEVVPIFSCYTIFHKKVAGVLETDGHTLTMSLASPPSEHQCRTRSGTSDALEVVDLVQLGQAVRSD